jgi:hypothetical protein
MSLISKTFKPDGFLAGDRMKRTTRLLIRYLIQYLCKRPLLEPIRRIIDDLLNKKLAVPASARRFRTVSWDGTLRSCSRVDSEEIGGPGMSTRPQFQS